MDVQWEFRKEIGMKEYYLYEIGKDSLKINWKVMALLLGTREDERNTESDNSGSILIYKVKFTIMHHLRIQKVSTDFFAAWQPLLSPQILQRCWLLPGNFHPCFEM